MGRRLGLPIAVIGVLGILLASGLTAGSGPALPPTPRAGELPYAPTLGASPAADRLSVVPADFPSGSPTVNWINITPSGPSPAPRESGAMVWDSTDGYLLLFGGEHFNGLTYVRYNDTWTFADGAWTNRTTSVAPSPRLGMMMADDPSDGGVVLFGGTSGPDSFHNDTWFYADGVWRNVTRPDGPPGRFWGSMSYDNATGTVVMYGGTETAGGTGHYAGDMWSYHAGNWTELSPAETPGDMDDQEQVADGAARDVFLFGGENDTIYGFNSSWTYANGTWSPVLALRVPGGRVGAGLAYDAAANAIVLYGGVPASYDYYATWIYADGDWTEYNTSFTPPAGTIWEQLAYDAATEQVVMFEGDGAYNATYALNLTAGSSPAPLAVRASVLPSSGTVPLRVEFNATADGGVPPYQYLWTFGAKGASSTEGNVSYTYDAVGTYTANLTLTDVASDHLERNWTITVSPGPLTASITASPLQPETNESVAFTSTASGGDPPYSYAWSFGDSTTSTDADPTHAYATAGNYSVSLVLTDSAKASLTRNLTIEVVAGPNGCCAPTKKSSPSTNASPNFFTGVTGIAVASLIVLVLLVLAVLLVLRRRRERTKPPETGPASPTGVPPPPTSPPPPPGAA